MTRSQLITKVSHDTGLPEAQVELVMNGLFDSIAESLKQGEKDNVDISHFLNSFVFGFYCAADSFFKRHRGNRFDEIFVNAQTFGI